MKLTTIRFGKYSLVVASICAMAFFSCDEQNALSVENDTLLEDISDDVELEASYEEIDDLSLAGASHDFSTGGKMERDGRFDCAEITREETDSGVIITIDFGEGCEGPNGRIRAGIIQITKDGDHWVPGSKLITELIGFSIDDLSLEGTRSVVNISESIESNPTFEIKLVGGKATWDDGTTATREVDRVRTLIRANNPLGDEIHLTGISNGVNRDGITCEVLILEKLVFLRICRAGKFIPVSGVKQITKGEVVAIIDFGNGECDNIATKTVDGVSERITIKPRRKR